MPTLDLATLERLSTEPPHNCELCTRAVRRNYCRQCDEYFEAGHMPIGGVCTEHARHDDHRTY